MYAALWRLLPGPAWLRAIEALLLVIVVVWALFGLVFPWLQPALSLDDPTFDR